MEHRVLIPRGAWLCQKRRALLHPLSLLYLYSRLKESSR